MSGTVENWYDGDVANYGFMIKARDENTNRRAFRSSEYGSLNPKLTITYTVDPTGIEDFWNYDGNVSVQNGNLFLSDVDVYLEGKGVPIQVIRSYNSRSTTNDPTFGYGWQLNVGMSLKYKDPANSNVILFTDADGTKHIFTEKDGQNGVWEGPPGLDLDLKYKSGTPDYYILTDKSKTQYYFDFTTQKLEAIIDDKGNVTDLAYNTDGTLMNMSDASGRVINFNYAGGKLDSITGSEITTVKYAYSTAGNLISVTKQNSAGTFLKKITFGYDGYHNVTSSTDAKGNKSTIGYYSTDRVYQISNPVTVNGTATTYTTTYAYAKTTDSFTTKVKDPKGIITQYTSNANGDVTEIVEDLGDSTHQNIKTTYTWDDQHHVKEITDTRLQKTSLTYGDKRNIEKVTNAKSETQTSKYDDKDNPISFTDFGGETIQKNYDGENNNIAALNTLAGTSVNEFDAAGNMISTTNPISLGDNIVVNNGFEDWGTSTPLHWTNTGTGTIAKSTYYVNGNAALRMDSSSSTSQATLKSDYLPVDGNTKYNISWYARTSNISGTADLKVEWYSDKAGTLISSSPGLAKATGTTGWGRKGSRIDSPANANYARLVMTTDTGTAWFDNVQMETGQFVNELNLVTNDGYEVDADNDGQPDGWNIVSIANTSSDGIDVTKAHSKTSSLLLNGSSTSNKYFGQDIVIPGEAGTALSMSGWSAATGVSSTGGDYMLLLRVDYKDGSTPGWFGKSFTKADHTWEYQESTITIPKDFKSLGMYVKYMNQTGQASFDDIKLRTVGVSNAMMSEYNIAQNGSFEYDLDGTGKADGWQQYVQSGTTATMAWEHGRDDDKTYLGNSAVSIKDSGGWAVYGNMQNEPIRTGKTYTASAMIKASGVTSGGGTLKMDLYDANGNYLAQRMSNPISGTTGWTRVVVSLSESEAKALNANAVSMKISVGTNEKTTGTVYFDAVRWQSQSITTTIGYDTKGNYVTSVTNPLGYKTTYQSDERGNVTKAQFPTTGSYAAFGYDALDRMTYAENATRLGIVYKYDANDNLTQVDYQDNGAGMVVGTLLQSYNELDQVTKSTDQNGNATTFSYDPNGNVTDVNYPNLKASHFGYDVLNRVDSTSFTGDNTNWEYAYDNNSNLTQVTKNGTEVTDYTMDLNLDRVTKITFPTVNGTRNTVSYGYLPSGQISSITNSPIPGTTLYDYDHSGRMAKAAGTNGEESYHMYNEAGQLKKVYTWDGKKGYNTYNDYNELGQLSRMRQESASGTILLDDTFTYDANGNRTEIKHKDGSKEVYTYDLSNRLTREQELDSTGAITSDIAYGYDVMGNRTSKKTGSTTLTYTYDKANQLMAIGSKGLAYDNNGNMTSDGSNTYRYNAQNQLTSVANAAGTTIAVYEYNHEGQRTKKVSGGVTEKYYYNAGHLAYITDGANTLRYSFTRDASGQLLTMTDYTGASPVNYFYVLDAHGNVLGLRNGSGTMVVSYTYDAFGNSTASGTATTGDGKQLKTENPFRYASYVFDDETGLYYLNARYYDSETGRFITRDDVPATNLYAYASNNPVIFVDSSGFLATMEGYAGKESYDDVHVSNLSKISSGIQNRSGLVDVAGAAAGSALGTASEIEKKNNFPGYIRNGIFKGLPKTDYTTIVRPFSALKKGATLISAGFLAADLGSIAVDKRFSLKQKLLKGGIVVAGTAVSAFFGGAMGIGVSIVTANPVIGGVAGVATSSFIAAGVGYIQNKLFRSFGLL